MKSIEFEFKIQGLISLNGLAATSLKQFEGYWSLIGV